VKNFVPPPQSTLLRPSTTLPCEHLSQSSALTDRGAPMVQLVKKSLCIFPAISNPGL
jgi:hypothetical protein